MEQGENTNGAEQKVEPRMVSAGELFKKVNPMTAPASVEQKQETQTNQSAPEKPAEEVKTEKPAEEQKQQEAPKADAQPEINDDAVLAYFKSKGKEVSSVDELFKQPETKEVNPYEELLDEEDKAYFEAKKNNPSLTRKQFDSIFINLDEMAPIDFARKRVLQESGLNLANEEIDEFLEKELEIDLQADELSKADIIKIAAYGKSVKDAMRAEQERLKSAPKATENNPKQSEMNKPEYVKLDNGTIMLKSKYDEMVQNHQKHLEANKEAVNSVTETEFKIKIDDNGSERELSLKYEFSDEDRHSMLSITSDVTKHINETYVTDKGFNQKRFNEDMFWANPKNREKAIASITNKVRAEAVEEVLKQRGNVDFTKQPGLGGKEMPAGVKIKTASELFSNL